MNLLRFLGAMGATLIALSAAGYGLASVLLPKPVQYFHTSYMEFAIPDRWRCQREGTEYVCSPRETEEGGHRAIMILGAKERGPQDTFAAYRAHLGAPQEREWGRSVVEAMQDVEVKGRDWVTGVHLGSEVPGFRTYYYAGVTEGLAVLMTFSAHESVADRYVAEIETLLGSLKLFEPDRVSPPVRPLR